MGGLRTSATDSPPFAIARITALKLIQEPEPNGLQVGKELIWELSLPRIIKQVEQAQHHLLHTLGRIHWHTIRISLNVHSGRLLAVEMSAMGRKPTLASSCNNADVNEEAP